MDDIAELVERAISIKLRAHPIIKQIAGSQVWPDPAPIKTPNNFVVWSTPGGSENYDTPRPAYEPLFLIWGVSTSLLTAQRLASAIQDCLVGRDNVNAQLLMEDWWTYRATRRQLLRDTQTFEGVSYFRRGAFYEFGVNRVTPRGG